MHKLFLGLLMGVLIFQGCSASAKLGPLTEVDVIRYAIFCPKFRQELKKQNLTGVVNNFCVLKSDKLDGRAHKIMKKNRYADVKKFKAQVARITEILALQQLSDKKSSAKTKALYTGYLPPNVEGDYQTYLDKNYSIEEIALVKKHSDALRELAR